MGILSEVQREQVIQKGTTLSGLVSSWHEIAAEIKNGSDYVVETVETEEDFNPRLVIRMANSDFPEIVWIIGTAQGAIEIYEVIGNSNIDGIGPMLCCNNGTRNLGRAEYILSEFRPLHKKFAIICAQFFADVYQQPILHRFNNNPPDSSHEQFLAALEYTPSSGKRVYTKIYQPQT